MNITQLLAHGPTLKTQHTSKTVHLKQYNKQQSQEQEQKVLSIFQGQKLTSRQIADAIGYATPGNVARQLRRMEKRGVLRIVGHTKAGHQLRSKIIWEEVKPPINLNKEIT